jgi:hypothetical protein
LPVREAALGAGFDLERVGSFLSALSVNAHGHERPDKTTQQNEGSRFHDQVN